MNETKTATPPNGVVENDSSARCPNLFLASCDLDLFAFYIWTVVTHFNMCRPCFATIRRIVLKKSRKKDIFTFDNGGGKCDCPRCLSVCLSVSKITQKRVHGFGWHFRVDRCRDTDEWSTFERDPDHSRDAGTGLLSAISYALQRGILLRRENPKGMVIGRLSQ